MDFKLSVPEGTAGTQGQNQTCGTKGPRVPEKDWNLVRGKGILLRLSRGIRSFIFADWWNWTFLGWYVVTNRDLGNLQNAEQSFNLNVVSNNMEYRVWRFPSYTDVLPISFTGSQGNPH